MSDSLCPIIIFRNLFKVRACCKGYFCLLFMLPAWSTFTHPRRPRGSQSGREKGRDESFQVRAKASSETQGQSVGSGEKARRKFSSTGERAPGYRLSPNYFQKFKRMPAPDWAQKMLCIIVPNRRTVSPEFFS